jgi:hypothetical protein
MKAEINKPPSNDVKSIALAGGLYVVTAYRAGQRDNHCYVVGVYDDEFAAKAQADRETMNRGGKYGCEVLRCRLNCRKEGKQVYYTPCAHQGDWGTGQDYITSNAPGEGRETERTKRL